MGSTTCSQNIKYLKKLASKYMAYSQNIINFSYGWSWRRLQNWKKWKD